MPSSKSAEKRLRQSEKRRLKNRIYRRGARTYVAKARKVIESGDTPSAEEAVKVAIRALDVAASKGIIHKNNAARRKSRLMRLYAQQSVQRG